MATPEEMDRLREALKRTELRVEIDHYRGHPSVNPQVAEDAARDAAAQNARGDRIGRIIDESPGRPADGWHFEVGLNPDQAQELIAAGAKEL